MYRAVPLSESQGHTGLHPLYVHENDHNVDTHVNPNRTTCLKFVQWLAYDK